MNSKGAPLIIFALGGRKLELQQSRSVTLWRVLLRGEHRFLGEVESEGAGELKTDHIYSQE